MAIFDCLDQGLDDIAITPGPRTHRNNEGSSLSKCCLASFQRDSSGFIFLTHMNPVVALMRDCVVGRSLLSQGLESATSRNPGIDK